MILDEIRADRRHWEGVHQQQLLRIDQRFQQIDQRFDQMDTKFQQMDHRFDRLEDRMSAVETRMGALEVKVGDAKSDLMKWSFVFWCGAVASIAALAGVLR